MKAHLPKRGRRQLVATTSALALGSIVGLALGLILPSGAIGAHATIDETVPADGSLLAEAPEVVEVAFSEPILVDDASVHLTFNGASAPTEPVARLLGTDPTRLVIDMPTLTDGIYQVRVVVHDRADLHEVVARVSFAIGDVAPAPSAPLLSPPEPGETVLRWLFVCGFALLVGVVAVRSRWPDVAVARPARLRGITIAALVTVIVGRVGVLIARALALDTDMLFALRSTISTPDARRMPAFVLACVCLIPLAVPFRAVWLDMAVTARRRLSVRLALGWLGVIWLAMLAAWGDHSALTGSVDPVIAVAKALHLFGLGLWIGVLAVTAIVNWARPTMREAFDAMSRIAIVGALLTVASGLLLAGRFVVSLTALLSTAYGQLLTVKVVVLLAAAALGWMVHRGRRLRLSMVELGMLAIVVLIGAAMSTAAPAIDRSFLSRRSDLDPAATAVNADDLLVQVRAIPNEPGLNTLEIRASDTRRPSPGAISEIAVGVTDSVESHDYGVTTFDNDIAYVPGVTLRAGVSQLVVRVSRDGLPVAAGDTVVTTRTREYVSPVRVSSAPIRPLMTVAALCVLMIAGAAAVRLRTKPTRPAPRHTSAPHPQGTSAVNGG